MKPTITAKLYLINVATRQGRYVYTDTRTGAPIHGALFTVKLNR
jgi:hypothetical protein